MAAPVPVAAPVASVAFSTLNSPAEGYIVERDLGVVFGTAVGANYTVSFSVKKALAEAARSIEQTRVAAMNEMGQQCAARGGNIVLGVSFDADRVQGTSVVTCWGTACVVKPRGT